MLEGLVILFHELSLSSKKTRLKFELNTLDLIKFVKKIY